jgi:hypothetical protein
MVAAPTDLVFGARPSRGISAVQTPYFHLGIVVADLEVARDRFANLLGVAWGPVVERDSREFRDGAGGPGHGQFRFCYSTTEPYLELIEELPGSVWECNGESNLHHVGFWSDSVDADSERWSASKCPLTLSRSVDDAKQIAYHEVLGVRFELVNTAMRARIEKNATAV